jgi:PPOX class probable F420-dependent enzyme
MGLDERTRRRLGRDTIAWLVTVTPGGQPMSSAVWFLYDGDQEVLVYSLEDTARVRNIAANPRVSFHLDSDGHGGGIVTAAGVASIDREYPAADAVAAYVDKYKGYMNSNAWSPEWFAGRYPVPIRIRLNKVRSW